MDAYRIRILGAISQQESEMLRQKTVFVAGCGGLGGYEPAPPASLSFTPPLCAAMQTALCVRLLLGRPVETGTLYSPDLLEMEFIAAKNG